MKTAFPFFSFPSFRLTLSFFCLFARFLVILLNLARGLSSMSAIKISTPSEYINDGTFCGYDLGLTANL